MQIDFTQEIKGLDDEPLREGDVANLFDEGGQIRRVVVQGKPLTLKSICVNAVGGKFEGEQLTVEQHIERFMLAQKIFKSNGEGLTLESDDIVLIKGLVARTGYAPIVVGQACQMLEGV